MSVKGIQKLMNNLNRTQQKRDWRLILVKTGKELSPPDWEKSVKKIDDYMESVCKSHGIEFKNICGFG